MEKVSIKQLAIGDFAANEAVNSLRTNFLALGVSSAALTSFGRSAGTTSVAFRLAASLAASGRKTLLIEADMRTGTLACDIGYKGNVKGLSACLSGSASPDEIITPTDDGNLFVIFAGDAVPCPSDLLSGKAYEKLIASLKTEFDYIIADTAPIGQVTDCAVAAHPLDGAILVINAKKNNYGLEQRAKNELEKAGVRLLGAVINRADYKDRGGYYGKAHGKTYGYRRKK